MEPPAREATTTSTASRGAPSSPASSSPEGPAEEGATAGHKRKRASLQGGAAGNATAEADISAAGGDGGGAPDAADGHGVGTKKMKHDEAVDADVSKMEEAAVETKRRADEDDAPSSTSTSPSPPRTAAASAATAAPVVTITTTSSTTSSSAATTTTSATQTSMGTTAAREPSPPPSLVSSANFAQLLSQAVAAVGPKLAHAAFTLAPPLSAATSTSPGSHSPTRSPTGGLGAAAPTAHTTPAWIKNNHKKKGGPPKKKAATAAVGTTTSSGAGKRQPEVPYLGVMPPSSSLGPQTASSAAARPSTTSSTSSSSSAPVQTSMTIETSMAPTPSPAHLIKNIINLPAPPPATAAATSGQYTPHPLQHLLHQQRFPPSSPAAASTAAAAPSAKPQSQSGLDSAASPSMAVAHITNIANLINSSTSTTTTATATASMSRAPSPTTSTSASSLSSSSPTALATPISSVDSSSAAFMSAPAQGLGGSVMLAAPLWAQRMAERRALLAKYLNEGYARVVEYVESMMIELESEKEAAIRLIALERAKLEEERQLWEEEKMRMTSINQFNSNKVRLNIGGQIFETTQTTLLKDPDHLLARMFSGRYGVTRDEHDAVFIDRDPAVFGLVLNYLRNNELSVGPREEGTLWKLLEEAKFYQIQSLIDCVKDKLGMRYVWHADWSQVCNSTEKFYQSPIFIVGGWPWRLSLVRDEGWLGISLTVSKRARQLPKGWRMNASFAVEIKNVDPKKVSSSMQHSDAHLDEARTGIFWRQCYELDKLVTDGVIVDDKLIISAEVKIESCTLID